MFLPLLLLQAKAVMSHEDFQPHVQRHTLADTLVPNSYVVLLKRQAAAAAHLSWARSLYNSTAHEGNDILRAGSQVVLQTSSKLPPVISSFDISSELRGYHIDGVDHRLVEIIRKHADVEIVEQHRYVYALDRLHADTNEASNQYGAPWGLGRVSHQGHENISWPYLFSAEGLGKGVDVYVLDSGVFADHEEFEGRVAEGRSFQPGDNSTMDYYYHGTHVAATIAGKTFGLAKQATIIPVKVLDKSGVASSRYLMDGMAWAVEQHEQRKARVHKASPFRGSVVNLSVGLARSNIVNRAADEMIKRGMHVVAAAGNEHSDACKMSPASFDKVITVGAIDPKDGFAAAFSNWGSCVDIHAPGVSILSAGIDNTTATRIAHGTSFAAPHVAAIVASLLSRQSADESFLGQVHAALTEVTPKQLKEDLLRISTKGIIPGASLQPNTTNAIAYNGGALSRYSEVIDRGGWPECCT